MSKQELEKKFREILQSKQNNLVNQTRAFQEHTLFIQYKIRHHFSSFSIFNLCGSERTKFMVDTHFELAFSNLTSTQQVALYHKTISYAININNPHNESQVDIEFQQEEEAYTDRKQPRRFKVQIEEGFHSWKQIYLTIDGFKVSAVDLQFDIRSYLLRRSKKKDRECYVLEAIHFSNPKVLRFCFLTNSDIKKHLPLIKELIDLGYREEIKRMFNIEISKSLPLKHSSRHRTEKPSIQDSGKQKKTEGTLKQTKVTLLPLKEQQEFIRNDSKFVQQIVKFPEEQDISMELNEFMENENQKYLVLQKQTSEKFINKERWYNNVFSVMLPNYQLSELEQFQNYKVAASNEQSRCFVFQNLNNPQLFKLEMVLGLSPELVLLALTNPRLYKNWHPEIVQAQIKLSISSQNSAIVYQKHKEYSQWYRQRDFIFLRHVFKVGQDYFMADKSIENINYIPFSTIHRGTIHWQIAKVSPSPSGTKLTIECHIEHGGLLNQNYAKELTTRYLLGYQKIQCYYQKKEFQNKLKSFFNKDWKIRFIPFQNSTQNMPESFNENQFQFQNNAISQLDSSEVFFSIRDQQNQGVNLSVHEVEEEELVKPVESVTYDEKQIIEINEEGIVILPHKYLSSRHPDRSLQGSDFPKAKPKYDDIVLKQNWRVMASGGLVLINKRIIAAQDNVLSYMVSTFRKNIFEKGPLNISLPVTIFNHNSQLSQYALSFGCAPIFLEEAALLTDPAQRMVKVMITSFSHSVLFFDIQKPFNPILGQTYQSYIGGCPFYAQQISHHPPVSALLFLGRGYKIFGNLEATVNIHLNSGDGITIGWLHVLFDDGQEICFQTPPAEFSGFAVGDRKFQFKEKAYYYDRSNNLYGQMCFQDPSGFFSDNKWKYRDQVQAQVLSVKKQFLDKFIADFPTKKHQPSKKQILNSHGKIKGRWPFSINYNDQKIYQPRIDLPFESIPYQYPLNSNTNYRQDLYYRKIGDDSKSQSEKQRLQQVQRGDRKLRTKFNGGGH